MSVSDSCKKAMLLIAFGVPGAVLAAESQEPEAEFLEYLGLWEQSDEEWLVVEYQMDTESEERIDPVPEGEESMEDDDES